MKATLVRVAVVMLWSGADLAPGPVAAAAPAYQVTKWDASPATLPGARYHFGTVHIPTPDHMDSTSRGHVMVAGGRGDGGGYLDSVYIYSVEAATWSESTKMPVARAYFGIAYISPHDVGGGGQVMVVGGEGVGGKLLDSVYLYSVDAATWSESTAIPDARWFLAMTFIPAQEDSTKGGQVELLGGEDDGKKILDAGYLYNVDAATWSKPTMMPDTRFFFGIAYIPAQCDSTKGQVMQVGGDR